MHTTNQLTAHVANNGIPEQLSLHFPRKWRIGEHLLQIINVGNLSGDFECIASKLETTSAILRQQLCNRTPVQLCATCLCEPKRKAKEHGQCQKNLRRLLTTIWHRKTIWKTSFQTNPQELSTMCIYPKQLLNNTKNVSIKKTLYITTVAQDFNPATLEEHPMNNHDLDRVLFLLTCNGKRQLSYRTWRGMILKGIFLSNF